MKILALETSSEFCSVALLSGDAILARETLAGQRHSELLLPMVDEVLAEGGLKLRELDGIAFGSGPGGFTGLRIACGVAQGLAFGAELTVVGVCTLEALAEQAGVERVIAALDARMGQIYHAAYEREGSDWREVREPTLCQPLDAPQVAEAGWTGCGSGFDAHDATLRERYDGRLARVVPGLHPRAREVARLAAPRFAAGRGTDPAEAHPLYVRNKVALKTHER
ncbi:MAG TPA: tRNA (adenosine(37)-N6)-threonylcarbamoyltransferase complex dimerization subunit type 1 TsaB [Burkholderiales bacterium]|nr:tRNA (adenosine(37)-N6)-threonylcarbamoyltransferase complex dimerization subunit type 1 TsaB [Burkholderiales bacterium]